VATQEITFAEKIKLVAEMIFAQSNVAEVIFAETSR
jgi:hypothetical protein